MPHNDSGASDADTDAAVADAAEFAEVMVSVGDVASEEGGAVVKGPVAEVWAEVCRTEDANNRPAASLPTLVDRGIVSRE